MTENKVWLNVLHLTVSLVVGYYGTRWILKSLDPLKEKKATSKAIRKRIFQRLQIPEISLNDYEEVIAADIVLPDDISVTFKDIGGLDDVMESIKEAVLYPLQYPSLFSRPSGLLAAPKGVLFYGPPGCGKTMLAKAIAKESGAMFINVQVSTLMDKWYGESQKFVRALFSLAHKLQPTIIFIDEIDCFLRERQSSDHEVSSAIKAEFMSLWDGLTSDHEARIVVMGATNRPFSLDQAILRRMPKRYKIDTPKSPQRLHILKLLLKDIEADPDLDYSELVRKTEGFSGSDLRELCRNAAMLPVREAIKQQIEATSFKNREPMEKSLDLRPVMTKDFIDAIDSIQDQGAMNRFVLKGSGISLDDGE